MSQTDAIAGMIAGEKKDWTPGRLIEVFCRPGLRSGFRESGRKEDARSHWYAGFCAYLGTNSYGPGIDGFDDGHALWGELIESGWTLIQDPGDRQFPYCFYMQWRPRGASDEPGSRGTVAEAIEVLDAKPETKWCMVNYCEGDFGVEVYDDEPAYRQSERTVRAL